MDRNSLLETRIQNLRSILYAIIETSNNLLDPEVILISRKLDDLLNECMETASTKCVK